MESLRPAYPAPRRVATAPIATPAPPRSTSAGGLVETLYNHPNVKIVAFTAASRGRARSPGRGPADEPGTLSAHSQLERTIAIGPFRIYRTGSVAFLNCGSALQPMLPKSQCWALEEDSSKFVLQIRRPNYWRIEIPVADPTEQELATALRAVLDQILQFEKTECPFNRSFTVTLPEKPKTPVKKRPWTPPVKGALPVLSTPAHEVSPTPKITPNSGRRASTSIPYRGRCEHRRFSVIGTEFQSTSGSRATSTDTSRSFEPRRDQKSADEASAILEEKVETEQPARGAVSNKAGPAPRGPAEQTIEADESANTDTAKPEEDHIGVNSDNSIAEESESKDPKHLPEPTPPTEKRPSSPSNVTEVQHGLGSRDKAKGEVSVETDNTSSKTKDESPSAVNSKEVQTRSANVLALEQPTSALSPRIREQMITVDITPRTPSSIEAGTPTPTNIYDVIRNYEQKLAAATPEPAAVVDKVSTIPEKPPAVSVDSSDVGLGLDSHSGTDGETESCEILEGSGVVGGRRKKLRGFNRGRALVPPQLTLVTSPPSKSAMRKTPILEEAVEPKEAVSPTGSADSFHSVQSWHSPVTPTPRSPASDVSPTRFPYPHENILIPKRPWHYRDISDMTVTPETRRTWDATSSLTDDSSQESAATAPDMASEAAEQPDKTALSEDEAATTAVARRPYIRHRATTSSISVGRRALEPLPPPANLFAPTATARRQPFLRSQLDIVRRIPMAIVSKTCEVLLGPPSHLITLMLQVAAKIAAGQWRGMMFGYGEGGETIPVQWDYSDDEYSSWGEDDDYYLSQVESSRANSVIGNDDSDKEAADGNADGTGRGWEVD